ncbi:MAG: bifunctional diaminohydroxyphosphoribosylaminopyrimidine deaminase/5-amino-6-(5-phosphoribosylamino)uracil reductase RibD [Armatimonadetes bacterium]|nr:bifunctional diaminohydroxyphosphoribosylaminopyrimidine deaminase/5-amino-6-(5-phosphoribosylamino)uracil reductase RibD [Armatimonadota bacterium]
MRRALSQARKALGRTSPNPAVGAAVVRDGILIGEGHTRPTGGPHAEIMALRRAGEAARGATLYVTLEPCSHFGRTPPCADAVLAAGLRRVVVAMPDPNPLVGGNGIRRLRESGIVVDVGLFAEESARVNEAWLTFIRQGRPFTLLKAAMSLDGKIATRTGDSKWISSTVSRAYVHRLRRRMDAVMVGIGTALADDPQLTPRPPGRVRPGYPTRIVVDSHARLPLTSRLFEDLPRFPLLVAVGDAPKERVEALEGRGAQVIAAPGESGRVHLPTLYRELTARQITSVLLEGGGGLAAAALEAGLVDKVTYFIAPRLLGGREALSPLGGEGAETVLQGVPLHGMTVHRSGPDLRVEGYVHPIQAPTLEE